MIDLTDLDRRAALALGLKIATWPTIPGDWYEIPLLGEDAVRTFAPTTDANDCREFVQFLQELHYNMDVYSRAHFASISIWRPSLTPVLVAASEGTDFEHGPTYDLVAQVLAGLAAVEEES